MVIIRRLGVMSVAKLYALLSAIMGLIIGIFSLILGLAMSTVDLGFGAGLGVIGMIILPIFYGIFGFIAGLIGAALYNLVAKWIGGIKIELKEESKSS